MRGNLSFNICLCHKLQAGSNLNVSSQIFIEISIVSKNNQYFKPLITWHSSKNCHSRFSSVFYAWNIVTTFRSKILKRRAHQISLWDSTSIDFEYTIKLKKSQLHRQNVNKQTKKRERERARAEKRVKLKNKSRHSLMRTKSFVVVQ